MEGRIRCSFQRASKAFVDGIDPGGFWEFGRLRSYLVSFRCHCVVGQVSGPCREERLVEWSAYRVGISSAVTLSANEGTGFRFEYLNRTNLRIVSAGRRLG